MTRGTATGLALAGAVVTVTLAAAIASGRGAETSTAALERASSTRRVERANGAAPVEVTHAGDETLASGETLRGSDVPLSSPTAGRGRTNRSRPAEASPRPRSSSSPDVPSFSRSTPSLTVEDVRTRSVARRPSPDDGGSDGPPPAVATPARTDPSRATPSPKTPSMVEGREVQTEI